MPKHFKIAAARKYDEPVDTFTIGEGKAKRTFRLFTPPDSSRIMALNIMTRFNRGTSPEALGAAIASSVDYLGSCMKPEEYEQFYEFLVNPREGMDDTEMMELCKWAVETTMARPTRRSTGSPRGPSTTGTNSTRKPRSKAAQTR